MLNTIYILDIGKILLEFSIYSIKYRLTNVFYKRAINISEL